MKKVIIWGAASLGRIIYYLIKDKQDVLFFVDNDPANCLAVPCGKAVLSPSVLFETRFDIIYIASHKSSKAIYNELTEKLNIDKSKIDCDFAFSDIVNDLLMSSRIRFLEEVSLFNSMKSIKGNVAELGVFRGDFAKEINRIFPNDILYLFDTFKGFDQRDLIRESSHNERYEQINEMMDFSKNYETSVTSVLSKMPFPDKIIIKEGFFPDSFDLENTYFSFVNIDVDLYEPIKASLEIFSEIMVNGGIILVHNYFSGSTLGVRKAVDLFLERKPSLRAIPIGDYTSIAIIGF
ncbi:MAG: macrocin-O-methyltransferase [Oscillospiraceae bacterium]|nr:macrocin-O-methyltransferase [Oscillospiraceae bacterium]